MGIEKSQSLSDGISDELLMVWEKSVRSSHPFLKNEDMEYFKPLIRDQYLPAVELFVIRNGIGLIAAFMGLSDDMLEMLAEKHLSGSNNPRPMPQISSFINKRGEDVMDAVIAENYDRIRSEVQSIIDT